LCAPSLSLCLPDCFDNIAKLEFTTEPDPADPSGPPIPTKTAIGMYSKEGEEYVPLTVDFHCQGAVEDWLNRLVTAMKSTLMEILSKAKFTADHWDVESVETTTAQLPAACTAQQLSACHSGGW